MNSPTRRPITDTSLTDLFNPNNNDCKALVKWTPNPEPSDFVWPSSDSDSLSIDEQFPNWRDILIPNHKINAISDFGGNSIDSCYQELFSILFDVTSGLTWVDAFLLCIGPIIFTFIFMLFILDIGRKGGFRGYSLITLFLFLFLFFCISPTLADSFEELKEKCINDPNLTCIFKQIIHYSYSDISTGKPITSYVDSKFYIFGYSYNLSWIITIVVLFISIFFIMLILNNNLRFKIISVSKKTIIFIYHLFLGLFIGLKEIIHTIYWKSWYGLWVKIHNNSPVWYKKLLGVTNIGIILLFIPLLFILFKYALKASFYTNI